MMLIQLLKAFMILWPEQISDQ